MPTIVIYQKPTCTTCRQVYAALKESGVDFDSVDYYLDPIPKSKLKQLIRKMGIKPRELLRTKEAIYKTLRIGERSLSDDEIVNLMVAHPDLIQRPIIEKGERAILARPAERLKEIAPVALRSRSPHCWPRAAVGVATAPAAVSVTTRKRQSGSGSTSTT